VCKLCRDKKKKKKKKNNNNKGLLDVDAAGFEGDDVLLDPGGGLRLLRERREHVVGDPDHDLDVGVGEGGEHRGVVVEELDLGDAIGAEELDDDGGGERVGGLNAPVHAQGESRGEREEEEEGEGERRQGG
jgi:hypothetical protein